MLEPVSPFGFRSPFGPRRWSPAALFAAGQAGMDGTAALAAMGLAPVPVDV